MNVIITPVLEFYLLEHAKLDEAGRLKLNSTVLRDFQRHSPNGVVMLHYQAEGAVGIYPPDLWAEHFAASRQTLSTGDSAEARLARRRYGALSQPAEISPQGRITLPTRYREYANLEGEVVLVGCEIGMEVWNRQRWEEQMATLPQDLRRERPTAPAEVVAPRVEGDGR